MKYLRRPHGSKSPLRTYASICGLNRAAILFLSEDAEFSVLTVAFVSS